MSVIINDSDKQTSTPAEQVFRRILEAHVKHEGLEHLLDIKYGQEIYIPTRCIPKGTPYTYKMTDQDIFVIRPDVLIFNIGAVVEIHGNAHDYICYRAKRDSSAYEEFRALGIDHHYFTNDDVFNEAFIGRKIKKMVDDWKKRLHPKWNKRRRKIQRRLAEGKLLKERQALNAQPKLPKLPKFKVGDKFQFKSIGHEETITIEKVIAPSGKTKQYIYSVRGNNKMKKAREDSESALTKAIRMNGAKALQFLQAHAIEPPRFSVGEEIEYRPLACRGVILEIINLDDLEDQKLQGVRYRIQLKGEWYERSVLEDSLLRNVKSTIINSNNIKASFLIFY